MRFIFILLLSLAASFVTRADQPNIVFILTDDHRSDCLTAAGNELARTPNLDRIAAGGTRFTNAFVTLAICSPSRAACLTGQYGSTNGVTSVGKVALADPQHTFAHALRQAGYATGVTGKWHLKTRPEEAGFDFSSICWSNGTWYGRLFEIDGEKKTMPGFVDDVAVDESLRFIKQASEEQKPFVLWLNTQVPHMDHRHTWPAQDKFLQNYAVEKMPLPTTWNDDLAGKPEYLKTSRSRTRALEYGYDDPAAIRSHARDYYASVEQMDRAVGRLLDRLEESNLRDNTWIILMGDNGWFLGEHGFTSKVLAYEESMRVPMVVSGPRRPDQGAQRRSSGAATSSEPLPERRRSAPGSGLQPAVSDEIVLNIDLTATIYDIAGLDVPKSLHGRSLKPLLNGQTPSDWRTSFLYEAPASQLGSQPLWAVRDKQWKYVRTELDDGTFFDELYDLTSDAIEANNVADKAENAATLKHFMTSLKQQRDQIEASRPDQAQRRSGNFASMPERRRSAPGSGLRNADDRQIPSEPPSPPRTDLFISGVYPHLTTYGIYSQNGAHYKSGHNECGIGAVVPWAGKLWMVNYAPHMPKGSEHKLYSIDSDVTKQMTVHPESVGGTPAGRMIHKESNQLLIAHHLIDAEGKVRTIQPKDMPMRVTAITRHLKDPANMVYYVDMEGSIWEANVHTLDVKRLFKKPVPGWHGKGAYVSQGRLVVSNNGELHVGNYNDVLVGGAAKTKEERGVLAEWDGDEWRIVERRQYTEVTGPSGITGGSDADDPIWSMGWDRRSVRFKLLEDGEWHTYLLPKAAYCNDAIHGWYTEWPRIREITDGQWMMDMHGMFFDFPKTFSIANSKGLKPIGSHLRYVPDFCDWNGRLVLASDETSIQGNPLAGQPQSNLWFGEYDDLKTWGPASGYGGPWVDDEVKAGEWSDPFLVAGFEQRCLHLAAGRKKKEQPKALRATDQQDITSLPDTLASLPRITVERGDWHKPGLPFDFELSGPATVYLAVDRRGNPQVDDAWKLTDLEIVWGKGFRDLVYKRNFPAGAVSIPRNDTEHTRGSFGMPHMAFVAAGQSGPVKITPRQNATLTLPEVDAPSGAGDPGSVTFTAQIDVNGTNEWTDFRTFEVPGNGATSVVLPSDLNAVWMRFKAGRDVVATAFLHQTSAYPNADVAKLAKSFSTLNDNRPKVLTTLATMKIKAEAAEGLRDGELFAGLADVEDQDCIGGLVYAAKRNRNLRIATADNRCFEFTKDQFKFKADSTDKDLIKRIHVEPEFTVDEASVIVNYQGTLYRLPKGHVAYDKPFASGWPRAVREVESERELANIHGTFYELPLVTNGAPPAWNLIRPVSSHRKQIIDFCSWNGLLVLSGIKPDAADTHHIFRNSKLKTALWFGGVDDLWKLGKPTGDGGPWKNTDVRAGVPSDPYLMRGYERKTVTLSHASNLPVTITLQIDIDGTGLWVDYKSLKVPAGESVVHEFPTGFSACWVRVVSDADTSATVTFEYR